ncbi:MAG: glycosyltransferase [Candidatus Aenigmatarchaeota archaeon]
MESVAKCIRERFFATSVTAIIPAYNEAATVGKVVQAVSKAKVDEIIVVDDGSCDETAEVARRAGAKVLVHARNRGKGCAMKTGLNAASGKIVVFIDADLKSLTPQKVNMLIEPILKGKADFVKSYFSSYKSKTGTSIFLYRPLLKHLFSTTAFKHPVSGQIAGWKSFFDDIEFRNDYGIDISILIDAIRRRMRIKEVCLGKLSHKPKSPREVMEMADVIIQTILEKADVLKR